MSDTAWIRMVFPTLVTSPASGEFGGEVANVVVLRLFILKQVDSNVARSQIAWG